MHRVTAAQQQLKAEKHRFILQATGLQDGQLDDDDADNTFWSDGEVDDGDARKQASSGPAASSQFKRIADSVHSLVLDAPKLQDSTQLEQAVRAALGHGIGDGQHGFQDAKQYLQEVLASLHQELPQTSTTPAGTAAEEGNTATSQQESQLRSALLQAGQESQAALTEHAVPSSMQPTSNLDGSVDDQQQHLQSVAPAVATPLLQAQQLAFPVRSLALVPPSVVSTSEAVTSAAMAHLRGHVNPAALSALQPGHSIPGSLTSTDQLAAIAAAAATAATTATTTILLQQQQQWMAGGAVVRNGGVLARIPRLDAASAPAGARASGGGRLKAKLEHTPAATVGASDSSGPEASGLSDVRLFPAWQALQDQLMHQSQDRSCPGSAVAEAVQQAVPINIIASSGAEHTASSQPPPASIAELTTAEARNSQSAASNSKSQALGMRTSQSQLIQAPALSDTAPSTSVWMAPTHAPSCSSVAAVALHPDLQQALHGSPRTQCHTQLQQHQDLAEALPFTTHSSSLRVCQPDIAPVFSPAASGVFSADMLGNFTPEPVPAGTDAVLAHLRMLRSLPSPAPSLESFSQFAKDYGQMPWRQGACSPSPVYPQLPAQLQPALAMQLQVALQQQQQQLLQQQFPLLQHNFSAGLCMSQPLANMVSSSTIAQGLLSSLPQYAAAGQVLAPKPVLCGPSLLPTAELLGNHYQSPAPSTYLTPVAGPVPADIPAASTANAAASGSIPVAVEGSAAAVDAAAEVPEAKPATAVADASAATSGSAAAKGLLPQELAASVQEVMSFLHDPSSLPRQHVPVAVQPDKDATDREEAARNAQAALGGSFDYKGVREEFDRIKRSSRLSKLKALASSSSSESGSASARAVPPVKSVLGDDEDWDSVDAFTKVVQSEVSFRIAAAASSGLNPPRHAGNHAARQQQALVRPQPLPARGQQQDAPAVNADRNHPTETSPRPGESKGPAGKLVFRKVTAPAALSKHTPSPSRPKSRLIGAGVPRSGEQPSDPEAPPTPDGKSEMKKSKLKPSIAFGRRSSKGVAPQEVASAPKPPRLRTSSQQLASAISAAPRSLPPALNPDEQRSVQVVLHAVLHGLLSDDEDDDSKSCTASQASTNDLHQQEEQPPPSMQQQLLLPDEQQRGEEGREMGSSQQLPVESTLTTPGLTHQVPPYASFTSASAGRDGMSPDAATAESRQEEMQLAAATTAVPLPQACSSSSAAAGPMQSHTPSPAGMPSESSPHNMAFEEGATQPGTSGGLLMAPQAQPSESPPVLMDAMPSASKLEGSGSAQQAVSMESRPSQPSVPESGLKEPGLRMADLLGLELDMPGFELPSVLGSAAQLQMDGPSTVGEAGAPEGLTTQQTAAIQACLGQDILLHPARQRSQDATSGFAGQGPADQTSTLGVGPGGIAGSNMGNQDGLAQPGIQQGHCSSLVQQEDMSFASQVQATLQGWVDSTQPELVKGRSFRKVESISQPSLTANALAASTELGKVNYSEVVERALAQPPQAQMVAPDKLEEAVVEEVVDEVLLQLLHSAFRQQAEPRALVPPDAGAVMPLTPLVLTESVVLEAITAELQKLPEGTQHSTGLPHQAQQERPSLLLQSLAEAMAPSTHDPAISGPPGTSSAADADCHASAMPVPFASSWLAHLGDTAGPLLSEPLAPTNALLAPPLEAPAQPKPPAALQQARQSWQQLQQQAHDTPGPSQAAANATGALPATALPHTTPVFGMLPGTVTTAPSPVQLSPPGTVLPAAAPTAVAATSPVVQPSSQAQATWHACSSVLSQLGSPDVPVPTTSAAAPVAAATTPTPPATCSETATATRASQCQAIVPAAQPASAAPAAELAAHPVPTPMVNALALPMHIPTAVPPFPLHSTVGTMLPSYVLVPTALLASMANGAAMADPNTGTPAVVPGGLPLLTAAPGATLTAAAAAAAAASTGSQSLSSTAASVPQPASTGTIAVGAGVAAGSLLATDASYGPPATAQSHTPIRVAAADSQAKVAHSRPPHLPSALAHAEVGDSSDPGAQPVPRKCLSLQPHTPSFRALSLQPTLQQGELQHTAAGTTTHFQTAVHAQARSQQLPAWQPGIQGLPRALAAAPATGDAVQGGKHSIMQQGTGSKHAARVVQSNTLKTRLRHLLDSDLDDDSDSDESDLSTAMPGWRGMAGSSATTSATNTTAAVKAAAAAEARPGASSSGRSMPAALQLSMDSTDDSPAGWYRGSQQLDAVPCKASEPAATAHATSTSDSPGVDEASSEDAEAHPGRKSPDAFFTQPGPASKGAVHVSSTAGSSTMLMGAGATFSTEESGAGNAVAIIKPTVSSADSGSAASAQLTGQKALHGPCEVVDARMAASSHATRQAIMEAVSPAASSSTVTSHTAEVASGPALAGSSKGAAFKQDTSAPRFKSNRETGAVSDLQDPESFADDLSMDSYIRELPMDPSMDSIDSQLAATQAPAMQPSAAPMPAPQQEQLFVATQAEVQPAAQLEHTTNGSTGQEACQEQMAGGLLDSSAHKSPCQHATPLKQHSFTPYEHAPHGSHSAQSQVQSSHQQEARTGAQGLGQQVGAGLQAVHERSHEQQALLQAQQAWEMGQQGVQDGQRPGVLAGSAAEASDAGKPAASSNPPPSAEHGSVPSIYNYQGPLTTPSGRLWRASSTSCPAPSQQHPSNPESTPEPHPISMDDATADSTDGDDTDEEESNIFGPAASTGLSSPTDSMTSGSSVSFLGPQPRAGTTQGRLGELAGLASSISLHRGTLPSWVGASSSSMPAPMPSAAGAAALSGSLMGAQQRGDAAWVGSPGSSSMPGWHATLRGSAAASGTIPGSEAPQQQLVADTVLVYPARQAYLAPGTQPGALHPQQQQHYHLQQHPVGSPGSLYSSHQAPGSLHYHYQQQLQQQQQVVGSPVLGDVGNVGVGPGRPASLRSQDSMHKAMARLSQFSARRRQELATIRQQTPNSVDFSVSSSSESTSASTWGIS